VTPCKPASLGIQAEEHVSKRGRPSLYSPEIAEEICERLSEGEPLAQICRDKHMPHDNTVRNWCAADQAVSVAIARAREAGFDQIALDAMQVADDCSRDYKKDADGRDVPDHDHIQRSKLRVETRLKLLAKWDPRRYGDRVQTEHSGSIGLAEIVAASYQKPGEG